jgi:hypothetical protein
MDNKYEKYGNYNFFEMYGILRSQNKRLECPLSWRSLIDEADKMKIPTKSTEGVAPLWMPSYGRYEEMSIRIYNPSFHVMEGDIIVVNNDRYKIDTIYLDDKEDIEAGVYYNEDSENTREMCVVSLKNMGTEEEITMTAWDLLYMIDTDVTVDIVYEKSKWLEYINKN